MGDPRYRTNTFRRFFLNNKFVLFLMILLLIGLNILVLNKIPYVFAPLVVLVKTVLLPLLLTGIAFYLLNPIVNWMERKRIKRVYAIFLLYLVIICGITLLLVTVVPLIREQVLGLMDNIPRYSKEFETRFRQLIGSPIFNQLQQTLGTSSTDWMNGLSSRVSAIVNRAGASIGSFVGAVTETILAVIIVPFILFYLLKDGRKLPQYILGFIPTALRDETHRVMIEMNNQISSYIRGQIIVSCCIGFLLYVGYRIIGLEYSLVLAIVAACTSIVPYLGPAIAITPALIVATVTSPVMLLKMIVIWTIVQLIEGKFISPQIMGKTLQIHPITIIFVILTAGNLFGVLGVILAVPGYAVLKVIVSHLFEWMKERSGLYTPVD
ncbi:AI-2E family transporter [Paenibacillus naphthalenovorans]|uniref:AI-2E family transporter n=1 Tax=Paenibacillus naphthalenovorans TaxID=162209 RepID=UPI00088C0596|nr:AI-2E family transporter [Paenibacillus naphthalenovorans]SDI67222.1 Predicted PurR-regulated permease PerM [Paenibacillus naphthalenovorans]